jgi:hypothetical protein
MKRPRSENRSSLLGEFNAFMDNLEAGAPPAGGTDGRPGALSAGPEAALRLADEIAADETARFLRFREACLKDGRP